MITDSSNVHGSLTQGSGSAVTFLPVDVLSVGSAATEVAALPGY